MTGYAIVFLLCLGSVLIGTWLITRVMVRPKPTRVMQTPVRDGRSSIVYLKDHVRH